MAPSLSASTALTLLCTCAVRSVAAANTALDVNPSNADAHITVQGSDFLWAIFAAMLASALGVTVWALFTPPGKRAFHFLGIGILFTASIAYFSMASNLGATPVEVEFVRYKSDIFTDRAVNPYTRQIWYARYIDWTITTPLLLLELLLTTGMPLSGIFATIFFDLVMIEAGLIGALVVSVYKWGYFTGACIAMFYVFWTLIFPARANAKALGNEAYKAYTMSALILAGLWLLYPVAWGLADGGNVISPDGEMIFYGVLDLLAKPVFLFVHLFNMRKVPYEVYQLQSGHYSAYATVPQVAGAPATQEKRPVGAHTPAAGNAPVTGNNAAGTTMYPAAQSARPSDVTAV